MNNHYKKLYDAVIKQKAEKSDAIVWLQGDRYDRGKMVLRLFRKKMAPAIVLTGNNLPAGEDKRPDEKNISINDMRGWFGDKMVKEDQIIIDDKSFNTKDQAEHVVDLAIKTGWKSIILVGSSYYQPRAFLTFLKQAKDKKWRGKIFNRPQIIKQNSKPGGRSKLESEYRKEDEAKINLYKKDLSSIEEGLEYLKRKVVFRRIKKQDSKRVWEIRNDKNNRIFMVDTQKIKYANHLKWFNKYLKYNKNNFFVLEINKEVLGYIRYDNCDKGLEISIAVDNKSKGGGLGSILLNESLKKLPENILKKTIIAEVKLSNEASQRLFEKNGFRLIKTDDIFKTYRHPFKN